MTVFFSSETTDNAQLAELWSFLESEQYVPAMDLGEYVCQDMNAPVEFFAGLSLAYGEAGYYEEAERVAKAAVGFGESNWHARHALGAALMHQGRFLGALDALGFYREPVEIYIIRAQIEKMGNYYDSLHVTMEDALEKEAPPAIRLYLAYLYGTEIDEKAGYAEVARLGKHLDAWNRDAARHANTPYGEALNRHITAIRRIIGR
jgi:hypothetical protein